MQSLGIRRNRPIREGDLSLTTPHQSTGFVWRYIVWWKGGIYGDPKDQALQVAIDTITAFLQTYDMQVYVVLFE